MKKIILTGGGTAGHVTPNIALMPRLRELGYDISYIGSKEGIEKQLITELQVPYYSISSGKLRRYFDLKNFTDPFKVLKGYWDAKRVIKKVQPDVIFSKGGFVSVPVVLAAKGCKVPTIIHESDMTPGLANKLCIPSAWKVCCNFPETVECLPADKAVLSGSPIRKELFEGDKQKGLDYCGFTKDKPVLMVVGGSLGALAVNEAVRGILPELLKQWQVVHLCGQGKVDHSYDKIQGYVQFEYVKKELTDLFAAADLLISRAGANAICEILALKKPNILIPLPSASSRGDQLLNARSFEKQGFSYILKEEDVTQESLLRGIDNVFRNKNKYIAAMEKSDMNGAIEIITGLIEGAAERK